jgi:hypothetical protein
MRNVMPRLPLRLLVAAAALVAPLAATAARADEAPVTVIDYRESTWRYAMVAPYALEGFEKPDYDDSWWSIGQAGFGTADGCLSNNYENVHTLWPARSELVLRKRFYLMPGVHELTIHAGVDDGIQIFVNGTEITPGMTFNNFCGLYDQFTFQVPDALLAYGDEGNVIAIRMRDFGGGTFFDMRLTGVLPAGG